MNCKNCPIQNCDPKKPCPFTKVKIKREKKNRKTMRRGIVENKKYEK